MDGGAFRSEVDATMAEIRRAKLAPLVQQIRTWMENPRINVVLLERGIFTAADIARIHDDLDKYNPRGLAMITKRLLSNRYVRRRVLSLAEDRRLGREAMDALRAWADVASGDPMARGN